MNGAPKIIKIFLGTLLFILFAALVAAALTIWFHGKSPSPLPQLGSVEGFTFTERSGKSLSKDDLRGQIWVANFIFTACPGPCFQLSQHFSKFQKEIAAFPAVKLVSFTVDPMNDTPTRLSAYGDRFQADPQRWLFVTGDKVELYGLIERSFRLAVQENYNPNAPASEKFIHSTRIVLVDGSGQIRGYYDGLKDEDYVRLKNDITGLLQSAPPAP